jgi:DNA-binding beta-propeller fold protein YncE
MIYTRRKYPSAQGVLGILLSIVLVCVSAGPSAADEELQDGKPVFFPLPPDIPRLQFLKKFSSALDVSTTKKGFRDFVFGGEENEGRLIQKPYGAGALQKPINITIDNDGTKYITDTDREQVLVFDANDRFVRALGDPGQFNPVDVAISGDRLYVTDIMHHQVHVLDKHSGEDLFMFGEAGTEPGMLFHPTNLAIGSDNTVYVTDTTNFRVQQFSLEGELIREVGSIGSNYGQFARPKGVAVDRDDIIYVVDAAFQNVQILGQDGSPLMAFGGSGGQPWNMSMPTVVKIDYDNVSYFEQYMAPGFDIEYLVIVANQFGLNSVVVFGFGELREN